MVKIVINTCFGGFSLSEEANQMLFDKKSIKYEKQDSGYSLIGPKYFQAGHLGDNDYYLSTYDLHRDRADPDLVAVVELLGKKADSWSSELKVVEVPDDVQWHINEYDGLEHVAEDHRTWD
jgi:hypothetical protein